MLPILLTLRVLADCDGPQKQAGKGKFTTSICRLRRHSYISLEGLSDKGPLIDEP